MTPNRRQRLTVCASLSAWTIMIQPGCQTNEKPESLPPRAAHPVRLEQQVTRGHRGRVLTNTGVWSPDSQWIVYDTRSDPAGEKFDGDSIEAVNINTGEVREIYRASRGAHCGVVTWHPRQPRVVFILGPEHPTPDWPYSAFHRQGVIARVPGLPGASATTSNLDARDLTPPFTPGALRGGSHVHVWDSAGDWVSFTYEDHVLAQFQPTGADHDINLRNVGVSAPFGPVHVSRGHPRNHDGEFFSVLVTRTTANPKPGSDDIKKACEEGWVGTNGYVRADGRRQHRALAFQGQVVAAGGETVVEVFIVDLPEDLTQPGDGPLAGTAVRMPYPPKGCVQRRLTRTADRKFPGIQGARHWLRSAPDGSAIAFLMKDDGGTAQMWVVSPNGGPPRQVTRNPWSVASAFTWSPDGKFLAHIMDNSVCLTDVGSGQTVRLTPEAGDASAPRPEACVFSPDGSKLAYVRQVTHADKTANQIFVLRLE